MTLKKYAIRPISLCLLILQACASAPPSPAPALMLSSCPSVTPCLLPAADRQTNGDLSLDLERVEAAWAICAAQVDGIVTCQNEAGHAQAR